MRKRFMQIVAGAAILGLSMVAGAAGISNDVVKIGVLTDMSGVYSAIGGEGSVTAAKMAARVTISPAHRRDGYYLAQGRALWDAVRGRWGRAPYDDTPGARLASRELHQAAAG